VTLQEAIALAKSRSDCHPNNIDTLVQIVNELKYVDGCIVECGSYRCGATIAMAAAAPNRQVYAFDLFGGLPYGNIGFENFADADFEEVQSVVSQFPNIQLIRGLHENTVPKFSAQPVALLFMDSDHYGSHWVALEYFWPMLLSGGMIVFHDWSFEGVQTAIQLVLGDIENENSRYPESPNMGFIVKN
jgi:O-methyltransferase